MARNKIHGKAGDYKNIKALQGLGYILFFAVLIGAPLYLSNKYHEEFYKFLFKEQVEVTQTTALSLVSLADHMVTLAKKGDLHSRRQAAAVVREMFVDNAKQQTALQKLFTELGPRYASRNGGYTRIIKTYNRRGDNAPMAIVQFVK